MVFFALLFVTFIISLVVSLIAVRAFAGPIEAILNRIINDAISEAWVRYLKFAIYVVGISGGVRINSLERYVLPQAYPRRPGAAIETVPKAIELTTQRWVLEIYRTIIQPLQSIAWMLLVFFVIALIAYVIVRIFESKGPKGNTQDEKSSV